MLADGWVLCFIHDMHAAPYTSTTYSCISCMKKEEQYLSNGDLEVLIIFRKPGRSAGVMQPYDVICGVSQ